MRRLHFHAAPIALAALLALAPASAHADFIGDFASANWTLTDTAGGTVNTQAAPSAITLIDGANQVGGSTYYTIAAPYSAVLTFDWAYLNNDLYQDPLFEQAFYDLNGILTELTDDLGSPAQNGTVTFVLNPGDIFGFVVNTFDGYYGGANGTYGSAFLTLSNFAVPEPASWPLLAAGAGALLLRRRRKQTAAVSL